LRKVIPVVGRKRHTFGEKDPHGLDGSLVEGRLFAGEGFIPIHQAGDRAYPSFCRGGVHPLPTKNA
jgi:hypothetical protein